MKHCELLFVLSLLLSAYLTQGFETSERNTCPENIDLVRCSDEYQGVCAFFKDEASDHELSQKASANTCIACLDPRTKYTVDGQCTGDKVYCDSNVRPEACTREYFAVCGYSADCEGDQCGIPEGNRCTACANPDVNWYVVGECPQASGNDDNDDGSVSCDPDNRPEICPLIYLPVCATLSDCFGDACTITAASDCSACANPNVASYVPGECPNEPVDDDRTVCDSENRPEACPLIYLPVCATLTECAIDSCTQTFGNGCFACSERNVISYVPGECSPIVTECDPKNRPEACLDIYDPVCATLDACDGDICTQTFGNGCSACSNSQVISYVPEQCPIEPADDGSTACDPENRPEICPLIYLPVCATLTECAIDSCTQTFGNGCSACSEPSVISYVPGECPTIVTECDPKNRPEICPEIYDPVCATLEVCDDGMSTRTVGNACTACSDCNVISYVPGECPTDSKRKNY